ncbi:DUF6559 family protein [Hahella ganghwensis]|uniref:DUF6559 family protein n=1 Tax=Hahella ganghwensis TaxID=286420 RepID=UPI00037EB355|nr:DUF6559 family protein [Hahella ganghwensis]
MNFFSVLLRKRAIKKHVTSLGPVLRERYGKKRVYTSKEVTDTANLLKLNDKYLFYAIALYCTKDEYEKSTTNRPQSMVVDYATARAVSFNIAIVTAASGGAIDGGLSSGNDFGDGFSGGDGT